MLVGQGTYTSASTSQPGYGGWNGGGASHSENGVNGLYISSGSGGGGTDICTVDSPVTKDRYGRYIRTSESYLSRIIVAGGGGGADAAAPVHEHDGGYGGGVSGGASASGEAIGGDAATSGSYETTRGITGGFGYGAGCEDLTTIYDTQGGGGGWYGGGSSINGGAGGSGYVYTSETASQYPLGSKLDSSYYLTGANTYGGDTIFEAPSGGNETGHEGNGYAKITSVKD